MEDGINLLTKRLIEEGKDWIYHEGDKYFTIIFFNSNHYPISTTIPLRVLKQYNSEQVDELITQLKLEEFWG